MLFDATVGGKRARLECGPRLTVGDLISIPAALVLDAALDGTTLTIHTLAPSAPRALPCTARTKRRTVTDDQWRTRSACTHLRTLKLCTVVVEMADAAAARAFRDALLQHAYPHAAPQRRVLVVCNPMSGQGRGLKQLEQHALPVLRAAGCDVDVRKTQRRLHARDIARELDPRAYDACVCVGGDGTMHELVNGLAGRDDAADALRLPLVPVPCGSGNGLYVSMFGTGPGFSVELACLAAIKGATKAHELCAVTQPRALYDGWPSVIYSKTGTGANGEEYIQFYAFLSQAIGLMADIDLGTEDWRFVGDMRFSVGFALGALRNRACAADVDVLIGGGAVDLRAMSAAPRSAHVGTSHEAPLRHGAVVDAISTTPLDLDAPAPLATWQRIDEPTSSLYAGKLPYVARSLMAFPYASSGDGALDVMIQLASTKVAQKIGAAAAGEHGKHVFMSGISYIKAEALRVTPRPTRGGPHYLSIDGEMVPYGPFQVEIAPLCMHLCTLDDDSSSTVGPFARPAIPDSWYSPRRADLPR